MEVWFQYLGKKRNDVERHSFLIITLIGSFSSTGNTLTLSSAECSARMSSPRSSSETRKSHQLDLMGLGQGTIFGFFRLRSGRHGLLAPQCLFKSGGIPRISLPEDWKEKENCSRANTTGACRKIIERAASPSQAPRRIGVQGGEERAGENYFDMRRFYKRENNAPSRSSKNRSRNTRKKKTGHF